MPSNIRKIVATIFVALSLFLSISGGYSSYVYFQVYGAVRNLRIAIPEFDVEVSNNSHIFINTTVSVENPSDVPLELVQVVESIHLEGEFVKSETMSTHGKPIQMQPVSITNVSIGATIPPHRIEYVKAHLDERWLVTLRAHLSGPMVETFTWTNSWLITDITKT